MNIRTDDILYRVRIDYDGWPSDYFGPYSTMLEAAEFADLRGGVVEWTALSWNSM